MKFLADQDVYQVTVEFLRSLGHDVQTASEAGLSRASDEQLLGEAGKAGRILLTRDKGVGALVFVEKRKHSGVILLRMEPASMEAVHQELKRFLEVHSELDFSRNFVVVEAGHHRIRTIP